MCSEVCDENRCPICGHEFGSEDCSHGEQDLIRYLENQAPRSREPGWLPFGRIAEEYGRIVPENPSAADVIVAFEAAVRIVALECYSPLDQSLSF